MGNIFKAVVNPDLTFEVTNEDISNLDALKISDSEYHILQDHKSYIVQIVDSNFNDKSYCIKINNKTYLISIKNHLDAIIESMGFSTEYSKKLQSIEAQMPGLILEIFVTVGQEVKENDPLLVLEAMKMENIITSPIDGIIKSIAVKNGDTVLKYQLLIEYEK